MGVSVYVGGSLRRELPWKCGLLSRRPLRTEPQRGIVSAVCPARFDARSLRGSGCCSKMRRRSWGNCKVRSCTTRSRKFPKPAGSARTATGSGLYMIIGRGCSTHSSAGSRSKRRAFGVAPAMQNPMLSWADRFRLSLTFSRIDRPRNCDAFKPNLERVIPFGKRCVFWKPFCLARSR